MVALREARDIDGSCSVHVVDSAGDWEDHFLVALHAPLVIRWALRSTQWRVEGVDRAALKDPVCCSNLKCALRAIKPPPWSMSVDEHERFAAGAVCKAAKVAFGAPARRPRREHIDCAAWALICDRRTVKTWCRERRVSAATRGIVPGCTPDPFWGYMWASSRGGSAPLACHVFSSLAAQVALLVEGIGPRDDFLEFLRVFFRHSGGVLKGYLKAACVAFLETTASELDAAQADLAWRKLRSFTCRGGAKWKGAKSPPGRVGEDGVAATTTQEASGVVLRHFAAIEAAEIWSVGALADRHGRSRSALALNALRDINNACDLVTLRRLFARSKCGKAYGIDGVRDDFCAIAPVEMANVYRPVLTKRALRVQGPLSHKCGIAVDLWEGKGDHSSMKWCSLLLLILLSRSITKGSCGAGSWCSLARSSLVLSAVDSGAKGPPLRP